MDTYTAIFLNVFFSILGDNLSKLLALNINIQRNLFFYQFQFRVADTKLLAPQYTNESMSLACGKTSGLTKIPPFCMKPPF